MSDGIAVGMAQAAESRHMHVAQSRRLQRFRQPILVELRIVERARHRAYVRDTGNSILGLQQSDKLIEWAVSVANSQRNWQDRRPGFRLSRDFGRFHLTGKRARDFARLMFRGKLFAKDTDPVLPHMSYSVCVPAYVIVGSRC